MIGQKELVYHYFPQNLSWNSIRVD